MSVASLTAYRNKRLAFVLATRDRVDRLAALVDRKVHSAGKATLYCWLTDMRALAEEGVEVERIEQLARMVEDKIKLERLWFIESWLTGPRNRHPRIRAWLHAQLEAA